MTDRDHEPKQGWRFDKSMSIGNLFTVLSALCAVFVIGSKFDTRLTVLETAVAAQRDINIQQESVSANIRKDVREDLRDINNKLDRLIEKSHS